MKANAKLLIKYKSPLDGLKSYGKKMNLPEVKIGDSGFVEPLSKLMINDDRTHAFYPSKWKYQWMFRVSVDQFIQE